MKINNVFIPALLIICSMNSIAQKPEDLMTPETLWQMGRMGSVSISTNGNDFLYSLTHYNKKENNSRTFIWNGDLSSGHSRRLWRGSSATFIGNGDRVAYLSGDKLMVTLADSSDSKPVCVANGVVDFLFSPDAKRVVIVRMVPSTSSIARKDHDLPKSTGMVINDLMYKHWDNYVQEIPHPFVAEFNGKKIENETDILLGEPFECPMEPFGGVEQLAWSPDGSLIAYTCRKKTGRDYAISTDSDIYLYDVQKKATIKNLCKPDNYKEPKVDPTMSLEKQAAAQKPFGGYDQNPLFSPDGTKLAWVSMERDGYESDRTRLVVMDLKKNTHTFVSEKFESGVNEFVWAPNGAELFFTGVWHGKTNVWKTNLKGDIKQITDDVCDYVLVDISRDGKTLYVKRHSMQHPDDLFAIAINGKASAKQLTDVNARIYKSLAVADVKERWVKTTDGKDMLCWVVYPPHFDPSKKYPALLFCEGGPQSPVSQFWSYRWNFQIMAANGYIVIAPNRRGLPGFGMEWLEQISGDYKGQCMKDYLSAIDDLSTEKYIDKERLGAVGASFGGFSVYWLAGNHDGRFKAFIAHDGIYNTQQQYVETEEMWFPNWDLKSAPWHKTSEGEMQKAYRESPHLYVDKWDTPILCIHGQRDFRIEYTQAESAFNAARLRGIDAQLLLFPDENHWVLKPQNGILWQRTFFRFLDKHLKK